MDWPSALIGFLVGAFTGVAGSYLGQRFTDQRYRSEEKKESKKIWLDLKRRYPDVIQEMEEDVSNWGQSTVFLTRLLLRFSLYT